MQTIVNRSILYVTVCIVFIITQSTFSQVIINEQKTDSILRNAPAFSIYKDNYFITGSSIGTSPTEENSDAKFQFSFKVRLQNKPVFWKSYLYLLYTQKSFWNIYRFSSPFAETNYNPGLMLAKPVFYNASLKGILKLSLEHESNGRDSIYSRSWNYLGVDYTHHFSSKLNASLKCFIPFGLSDNPNLMRYIGFTEAHINWELIKNQFILDFLGRKAVEWNNKGSLMTTLSYRPSTKRNIYWSLQWFVGYSESLIDYQRSTNMLRIGLTIKPNFFRIY